ncbi:unnamed protein product [Owenia fusiformis]|uniref:Uncharacterized protein n=1 Tax=Owenia fusiformis TaxID=6347 RepID=A0A8J1XH39_OWEFU|nr:unnamed protein product [Owenia fusiformis]
MAENGSEKPSFSFGFSKKIETKKLQSGAIKSDENNVQGDPDFVTSVEGTKVKSTRPEAEPKKPLVIPLITTNNWKTKTAEKLINGDDKNGGADKGKVSKHEKVSINDGKDDLESEAIQELVNDAKKHEEDWEDREKQKQTLAIPLLLQNKVPEGFETDEKLNVDLRPDGAQEADYDEVPIEQYGMAMLRGMGFSEEEGIGSSSKRKVKPIEVNIRPKGLGLGADRSALKTIEETNMGKKDEKEEKLILGIGAYVVVTGGANRDLYGKVEGIDGDQGRVVIKLALSGKSVSLSQYIIKLVSSKEYEKYSKYLNKGKSDKYKDDGHGKSSKNKDTDSDSQSNDSHKHRDSSKHRDSDKHRDRHRHSEKHRDTDKYRDSKHGDKSSKHKEDSDKHREDKYKEDKYRDSRERDGDLERSGTKRKHEGERESKRSVKQKNYWLRPHLRVRIVDENYKKGKYYNTKVKIVDVVSLDTCICQTEEGRVLDDVTQRMLETVVPKTEPSYAMIISGTYKGQLCEVLKRNKSICQATVQLLQDREQIKTVDYDHICEYIGDINLEFDF